MSLLFRLESGLNPFGHWEEVHSLLENPDCGLYLYPEVSFAPADNASIFLRSLISPVDQSALTFTGLSWNIYQGFTMHFYFAFLIGETPTTISAGANPETCPSPPSWSTSSELSRTGPAIQHFSFWHQEKCLKRAALSTFSSGPPKRRFDQN